MSVERVTQQKRKALRRLKSLYPSLVNSPSANFNAHLTIIKRFNEVKEVLKKC